MPAASSRAVMPDAPPTAAARPAAGPTGPRARAGDDERTSSPRPSSRRAPAPTPAPADEAPDALVVATRFAGAFHLVNALERLGLARRLVAAGDAAPSSSWRLLRDLAAGLGLDPEDPLAGFLTARIADAAALGGDAPPDRPHPLADSLAADAAAFYGRFDVWDARLVAVPGRLEATPTHLDVALPASRIRLAVRRAGLDLDPGWVPWLGRVVRFVYEGFGPAGGGR
jgi:hypothetical protein